MVTRLRWAVGIGCALVCQFGSAQTPSAQIKKTSTAPVIDGNINDAVWANANVYGTTEFNVVEGLGAPAPLESSPDIALEWRALWDDTNLYVMAKINDDAIVNSLEAFGGPDTPDYRDDGIEFYIDAQDVNNPEYNPGSTGGPTEPTYQFTSLAGWTPAIADDPENLASPRPLRDPSSLPNTSITQGINSYDGNQVDRRYPQTMGSATSGPITTNPGGGFDWTFEASFPWVALEETPADILARGGIFGLGVAYNDDDDMGDRDNQYMWATTANDLWHVSASFPDVQLVQAASKPGDFDADGDGDGADFLLGQRNAFTTSSLPDFKANFGPGGVSAVPEPAGLMLLGLALLGSLARRRS